MTKHLREINKSAHAATACAKQALEAARVARCKAEYAYSVNASGESKIAMEAAVAAHLAASATVSAAVEQQKLTARILSESLRAA